MHVRERAQHVHDLSPLALSFSTSASTSHTTLDTSSPFDSVWHSLHGSSNDSNVFSCAPFMGPSRLAEEYVSSSLENVRYGTISMETQRIALYFLV